MEVEEINKKNKLEDNINSILETWKKQNNEKQT
jgi:hypothetical protein